MRYVRMLGDGDSRAYKAVLELNPYNVDIEREECTNHAHKSMGTALRNISKSSKGGERYLLRVLLWRGWSLVYMLKRLGDRTLPCGKPFFCFLHLLRSLFSSTLNLLPYSMVWISLHSGLS